MADYFSDFHGVYRIVVLCDGRAVLTCQSFVSGRIDHERVYASFTCAKRALKRYCGGCIPDHVDRIDPNAVAYGADA